MVRRQLPVARLCAVVVLLGLILWAVSWRNVTYNQLQLDVGVREARIDELSKRNQQLEGLISAEASFPRIARWAKEQRGWKPQSQNTRTFQISSSALTPQAHSEAKAAGVQRVQ